MSEGSTTFNCSPYSLVPDLHIGVKYIETDLHDCTHTMIKYKCALRIATVLPTMAGRAKQLSEILLQTLLFFTVFLCDSKLVEACVGEEVGGLLLCRSCGHELAFEKDANFIHSRLALSYRNDTVIGERRVPVQRFENPQGYQFEVMTFRKADVVKHWPADKHFTWYPGYAWTVATCPRCNAHLGWAFQPIEWPKILSEKEFEESEETFVALVINRLLQETFASTLLIPKAFRS